MLLKFGHWNYGYLGVLESRGRNLQMKLSHKETLLKYTKQTWMANQISKALDK